MTALPLTVIGGYLGAGKTTLINRLLQAEHGRRLMVLVNDFGAINIDASLLVSAREDTIELTNGCVCCTMGADLFHAVGDVLDRHPRPDHLLIEASGIADPARIARLAQAEPDLRYAGIVTVVDGPALPGLLADPQISAQITGQLEAADLLAIAKGAVQDHAACLPHHINTIDAADVPMLMAFISDPMPDGPIVSAAAAHANDAHPNYVHRACANPSPMTEAQIRDRLARRPKSVIRIKGLIPAPQGGGWEVHTVGQTHQIRPLTDLPKPGLVAIALGAKGDSTELDQWWQLWQGQGHCRVES